jgi:hypothetical protein
VVNSQQALVDGIKVIEALAIVRSKAGVTLVPLRYRSTAEEKRYQLHLLTVDCVVVVVGDCCAPSKRGQK